MQLSPDGRFIAYVLRVADREQNSYRSAIWLADTESGKQERISSGDELDAQPRWSPDSRSIAFTAGGGLAPPGRKGSPRNLFLVDIGTGSTRQLTQLTDDVSLEVTYPIISEGFAWSPSGTEICYSAKVPREGGSADPSCFVYDRLRYKSGELGWWDGRRRHLWIVSVRSGSSRQLTSGDWDASGPQYSPDGKLVAFSSSRNFADAIRNSLPDTNPSGQNDVWLIGSDGVGDARCLTDSNGPNITPSFSPDSRLVAYFGHPIPHGNWGYNTHLWVRPAAGGEARDVIKDWDHTAGSHVMSDVHDVYAPPPAVWSPDGSTLYFQGTSRGSANLFRVSVRGGNPEQITEGEHEVQMASFDKAVKHVAALIGDEKAPSDLYFGEIGSPLRKLTDINADFLSSVHILPAERFSHPGEGGLEIDAWVIKPPDFDSKKTYPMILEIFPSFVHGPGFNFEYQLLANHGYVIYYSNPRGATSYGEEFAGYAWRGSMFAPYGDLMAGVDHMIASGYVDKERIGVTGDAFGGSLTNWIICQTGRFAASAARRGATNLWSGAGDRTMGFKESQLEHYRDPVAELSLSPILHAPNVTTPHMIIHSAKDLRSPIANAEDFFIALRALGKKARLVAFQNDAHFLTRTAAPRDRVVFFGLVLSWFDEHLKPGGLGGHRRLVEDGRLVAD